MYNRTYVSGRGTSTCLVPLTHLSRVSRIYTYIYLYVRMYTYATLSSGRGSCTTPPGGCWYGKQKTSSSFSLSLSSLELSYTKVYEPQIRALLGTASHFCEVVVHRLQASIGGSKLLDHASRLRGLPLPQPSLFLTLSLSLSLPLSLSIPLPLPLPPSLEDGRGRVRLQGCRCHANSPHITQSGPESGRGFQAEVMNSCQVVLSSSGMKRREQLDRSVQFSIEAQLFRRDVKRFREGLVLKAHTFLCHSNLGSRVVKKKNNLDRHAGRLRRLSCLQGERADGGRGG